MTTHPERDATRWITDAAGRGPFVLLVGQADLAGHSSSASTELIHGGLRYSEPGEVRLVREALIECERLWAMAPRRGTASRQRAGQRP